MIRTTDGSTYSTSSVISIGSVGRGCVGDAAGLPERSAASLAVATVLSPPAPGVAVDAANVVVAVLVSVDIDALVVPGDDRSAGSIPAAGAAVATALCAGVFTGALSGADGGEAGGVAAMCCAAGWAGVPAVASGAGAVLEERPSRNAARPTATTAAAPPATSSGVLLPEEDFRLRLPDGAAARAGAGADRGAGAAEALPEAGTATGALHSGQRTFLPAYLPGTLNS
jgi:hypothetical protein